MRVDAACREAKRINVSGAFFLSIEFQKTGLEAYLTHRAAFGRPLSLGYRCQFFMARLSAIHRLWERLC